MPVPQVQVDSLQDSVYITLTYPSLSLLSTLPFPPLPFPSAVQPVH